MDWAYSLLMFGDTTCGPERTRLYGSMIYTGSAVTELIIARNRTHLSHTAFDAVRYGIGSHDFAAIAAASESMLTWSELDVDKFRTLPME